MSIRPTALRRTTRRVPQVLVVGSPAVADRLSSHLAATGEARVVGYVDDDPGDPAGRLGHLAELRAVWARSDADHVLLALSRSHAEESLARLGPLRGRPSVNNGARFRVVPNLYVLVPRAASPGPGPGAPGDPGPVARGRRDPFKRAVDVAGALAGLVLLAPLLVAVALAVRLTSAGPVLFRQTRIGRHSQPFSMLKFRSMAVRSVPDPPADPPAGGVVVGPFPKLRADPRVTRVGRVIRRLSIDELPQLWNVVRGDMSLVGPRPFVPTEDAQITGWARARHEARPGITGLWQVAGRNDVSFDDMCRLDHLYVNCRSVHLDVRIMLATCRAVAHRHGAY